MLKYLSASRATRKRPKPGQIKQIDIGNWPIGLEQDAALLDLTPADLTKRVGARFAPGADGLDGFQAAILQLTPSVCVALQSYDNYPVPGTKLIVDAKNPTAINLAVSKLGLRRGDFKWVSPDFKQSLTSALVPARAKAGPVQTPAKRAARA